MMYWRNHPTAKALIRMGYEVAARPFPVEMSAYAIVKSCPGHRLWLVFVDEVRAAVVLQQAPVKRQRNWREVPGSRGVDWTKVPAAWFSKTVESITRSKEIA